MDEKCLNHNIDKLMLILSSCETWLEIYNKGL